ncbi:MAG: DUF3098 domain-containing protein [Bacteroidota bacterium]
MSKQAKEKSTEKGFFFGKENYKLLIIGVVLVILGFILMLGGGSEDPTQFNQEELFSFRRITLAPLLVIAGYGVVTWAILKKPKNEA